MSRTESEDRAIKKYLHKFENVQFRVLKGEREPIALHAEKMGEYLNQFLRRAVKETMERDNEKKAGRTDSTD